MTKQKIKEMTKQKMTRKDYF